jgi:spore coat protein CotF
LKDFWIVRLPEYNELHIARKRGVLEIVLQTGDMSVPDLRATLSQFINERQDQTERLIDRIIRLTKL